MKYLIIDDLKFKFSNIAPLRSQLDIRVGVLKLRQRIEGYLGLEEVSLIIDRSIEEFYQERFSDKSINLIPKGEVCLVNGRLKIDENNAQEILQQKMNTLLLTEDKEFIALKFTNKEEACFDSRAFLEMKLDLFEEKKSSLRLWESLEEIITELPNSIQHDYQDFFYDKDNYSETEQGVTVINPYDVWIGEGAVIKHGTVLDATNGAIIIDEGAQIGLNTCIEGPAYIGKETILRASTIIRSGVSIGKKCDIGGEIVNSIFQAYSVKPYRGTLNRCYIGEWTKFEAGLSVESDFFENNAITKIRDYSLLFSFNNSTDDNICQYQEMRASKLKNMKIDRNVGFSKIEHKLLKQYLNEEI